MPQHVLLANEPGLHEMVALFFSSNIPLNFEKNTVEKLCKVLQMELETYASISPKFIFDNFIR